MASSKSERNTSWASPTTWNTGQALIAVDMNAQIRDKLNAVKNLAAFDIVIDEASNYSTSSTTFATIGGAELSATITTGGGTVLVGFSGEFSFVTQAAFFMDILVDGNRFYGDDGMFSHIINNTQFHHIGFVRPITGLSAASHTFALQWKVTANTVTLYAGAATSAHDTHPSFWGREVG
jgi:hypothetical protein